MTEPVRLLKSPILAVHNMMIARFGRSENFVVTADLSKYDLSGAKSMYFELETKAARLNMHLPESLLAALKVHAKERGIPYQRFIREALEQAIVRK